MSTCARPNCTRAAQPGHNRGLCHTHYDADPRRGYVPPDKARTHLAQLRAHGMTEAMIGEHGLSKFGIRRVEQAPRIRRTTEAKVLSIPVPNALLHTGADVDATGTRRRIQALMALGWPQALIGAELGVKQRAVSNWLARQYVTARNAKAVADLYDRLSMTPGPSEITRSRALARGWVPPLAWDDIDDPAATPQNPTARYSFADRYRDARHHKRVTDVNDLAAELRVTPRSLLRQVTRHRKELAS